MSRENVALYERVMAALNRREISDEVAEEMLAPDFRIENVDTAITAKTYHGAPGVREWIADTFDGLDPDARFQIDEILADGDDFVVGRVRIVGQGARSGMPMDLRWVAVLWFHDGRATRGRGYPRRREALKAVGLEE
jgi:ketosteroid isomerase-like protein